MRRIVMFNRVSADGFFAAADGNLDWIVRDPEVDRHGASGIPRTDTVILGRRTYEQFASFWPHVLNAPAPVDPHGPGGFSPELHAFARALTDMTKLVFSTKLKNVTWENSRLQRDIDPHAIEAMKRQPGKDMIIFGSGSIVTQLTRQLYYQVGSAGAQVAALEAAESSSKLALEATQLGFKVGVRVNIDVLNAQAQLFNTQAQLAKARYDLIMAGLRLRQASGQLAPQDVAAVDGLLIR